MQVIITGKNGFVGTNLSEYLEQRNNTINFVSLRDNDWKNKLDKNSDAIIHLAGKAHDTSNTSNPEEYFLVNTTLTINLFEEFLKSNIKDFFYFSSVKAVADTVASTLVEDVPSMAATPYGKSKFAAEEFLMSKNLPIGKRLFIIRPCMIHGPGNKGNLNLLYKIVDKRIPWPLASFNNQRSFLSIDNLSYLVFQLLSNSEVSSGVYNFSDDNPLSTNQVVSLISKALGNSPKFLKIPQYIVKSFVKIGDLFPLPLNSERLKKLTESYVVSNYKIKEALNIKKLPVSAEDGLINTIRSFKSQSK